MADDTRPRPGRLIVIDGPEGSGKSTQVERLADHVGRAGRTVHVFRDPGGTQAGECIRTLLLDQTRGMGDVAPLTEILLFLASRAQLIEEKIRPALERGHVVLLDRFHYSTVAYQIHGLGRGQPARTHELVRSVNGDVVPDRVFLLDLPPEIGLERLRGQRDRIESRDAAFHQRVREGFLEQAQDEPDRIVVIDAAQSPDAVHARLVKEVDRVL